MEQKYEKNIRTLQRDLSTLKDLLEEHHIPATVQLSSKSKTYSLVNQDALNPKEILAITKILLESRSLNREEMTNIINHLLNKLQKEKNKEIHKLIANELLLYQPLQHNQALIDTMWNFSTYIRKQQVIEFTYKKNRGQLSQGKTLPVSIFFSEYYFYVLCYNAKHDIYLNYRLDRFISTKATSEKIRIPYQTRLQDGELRKKVHFMYGGNEVRFTFQFWGIVEAALDKLPESKVIQTLDDSVIIAATAVDTGVLMWLLSQGSNVKVLSPTTFVEKMRVELNKMLARYTD
jgi:predicted DNA-binding transcriptional regulator YafY